VDIRDTVHTLFEKHARHKPDNIAALYGKQSLTYDELNRKANQLAHYLLTMDLKPDTPVAFCMERSLECLITILAILKTGAAYLPLDSLHPKERLLFILQDSNAPVLITKANLKEQFTQYQGKLILLDQDWQKIHNHKPQNPDLSIKSEQLAYVIYTSGSTGIPKGVLIEHQSVINYCRWFADYCSIPPKQRIDFSSNHTFDMAITLSIAPLMLGLTIVMCDDEVKKNVRHYLKYLKSSKANLIKLTPSFFRVLLQEVKNKFIALPYLKTIILGGENLSTADCKSWLDLYPKHILYNEYGPTETTVGISQYKICSSNVSDLGVNVPIGKAGYNINYMILDANNIPVPDQEIGELHIGGICLARGYLNKPELTQKQFVSDPFTKDRNARLYKTGDLCRLRADGVLEYFGRSDAQVKIRGYRIEPGEIEKYLAIHPTIDTAIVLAQKNPLNEDCLVAYYVPKASSKMPNVTQLREYLQKHLPDYMIPNTFISVNSFPLTANGKLDTSLLPAPQLITNQQHREPLSEVEKSLAEIWSEELGVKTIGLDDDFFELGGHSLSAARIISKINRVLRTDLTLRDFYYATNIAQLSSLISTTKKRKKFKKKIKPLNHGTDIPLSDFQFMLWISDTFESKAKKLNIAARKRLQGTLDRKALESAFDAVLKKQEILFYRILKLRPVQLLQKNLSFKMTEIDLTSLSEPESEKELKNSMNQLISYYPWPKDSPLILARLFYLKNNRIELQISMPHIVCDDFSPEILLSDLSRFYLHYLYQPDIEVVTIDKPYKEYIFNEQHYFQKHLDRDINFWDKYLKNAGLFVFPAINVVKNMEFKKLSYSTYLKIQKPELNNLKQFCAKNHISMNDGLCAATLLALYRCAQKDDLQPPYIYINIVKSTRNNEMYDDTIGCFLRLEPVKIALDDQSTLETISRQIHQSTIDTSPYQQCPDLIKLSAISTFLSKRKIIKNFLINMFTSIYATLFSLPEINRKIFKLCTKRLAAFKRNNNFLININVSRNFISEPPENQLNFFGLDAAPIHNHQYDLLKIDNVFDVCFVRDENNHSPYVVISANLRPEYRELIAKEIIQILGSGSLLSLQENILNKIYEKNHSLTKTF
jgi:amino acid adenylation domain-containing protein